MTQDAIIVFAGPSLGQDLPFDEDGPFLRQGPAAQGDVLRAALLGPRAIVLIDGYFEHLPSVYHKEIIWALHHGIPVFGAASTGALRAAELHPFGMIGVGEVFEAYADNRLVRDDAVALVHAPQEMGYRALSEPLVNIQWTLKAAVREDVISQDLAASLLCVAEGRHYPDRSFDAVLASCRDIDAIASERMAEWLPSGRIDIKNADALACLRVVADAHEAEALPKPQEFPFHHTDAFESLMHEVVLSPEAGDPQSLDRLKSAAPEHYEDLQTHAVIAELALALDRSTTQPVAPADLARQVNEFRTRHGLYDQSALLGWLSTRGMDVDTLSRYLEEQARIGRACGSIEALIPDRMRKLLQTDE